jgi:lipopolysaccharide transport system ATP-binding protein
VTGQDFDVVLAYSTNDHKPVRNVNFALLVSTFLGETMLHLYSLNAGAQLGEIPPDGLVRCTIPRCPVPAGQYSLTIWADIGGEILDWVQRAAELTVTEGDFYGSGRPPMVSHQAVLVDHGWAVEAAGRSTVSA